MEVVTLPLGLGYGSVYPELGCVHARDLSALRSPAPLCTDHNPVSKYGKEELGFITWIVNVSGPVDLNEILRETSCA